MWPMVFACRPDPNPPAAVGDDDDDLVTGDDDDDDDLPPAPQVSVADGEDWWVPPSAAPGASSGFFSEGASPGRGVDTGVVDVTWAQLEPHPGQFATDRSGSAQGLRFPPLDDQYPAGSVWVRVWTSGVGWAPDWIADECGVQPISGRDYDGQQHWPIWDPCVWSHVVAMYDEVLVRRGLLADPDVKLVYVPGAFTWAEYDYDMVNKAVAQDGLTWDEYSRWYDGAVRDLARLGGDHAHKLVFTGEDYPYSRFGARDDLLARDMVAAGLGVRSGITEVSNNHLSEAPAYGVSIGADGHLHVDEAWPAVDGRRVVGAENECFDACGFHTDDPWYAVRQANLKALQLRVNWLYVVPGPSFLADYPDHWAWVRAELGHTPATAFDAWAELRDAEDRYWADEGTGPDGSRWEGFPYVKNLERWLVQRDTAPDGYSRRGTERREGELDPYNGVAFEGRRTDPANGSPWLYFDVDPAFRDGPAGDLEVKVTFRDGDGGDIVLDYVDASGPRTSPGVRQHGTGELRTATFSLPAAVLDGSFAGGTDFRVGDADVEVTFVRVIPR